MSGPAEVAPAGAQAPVTVRSILNQPAVLERFRDILGKRADAFVSAILQVSGSSATLAKADPATVVHAAVTAATLNLSLNRSLGEAWIVPYYDRQSRSYVAQFQLGYKGFVTLAHRTGKYVRMTVTPIYRSQYKGWDPVREQLFYEFDEPEDGDEVAGYYGYIRLTNGFEKAVWWPIEKVVSHARRHSDAYRDRDGKRDSAKASSPWASDFDAMSSKTVLKLLIDKWGPKSHELALAIEADQSTQIAEGQYTYVDNVGSGRESRDLDRTDRDKERARVLEHIRTADSTERLMEVQHFRMQPDGPDEQIVEAFDAKATELIESAETDDDE